MQYRVYKRQSLRYVDGGYVQKISVDDDYLVNNNSTINVVKKVAPIVKQKTLIVSKSGSYDIGIGNTITNIIVVSGDAVIEDFIGSQYSVSVLGTAILKIIYEINDTLFNVVVGDIIALIEDSEAVHKGVITAVDDVALTISYKGDKELFNDNIPNPFATEFDGADNDVTVVGKFGVDVVIELLRHNFVDTGDPLKNLPIVFVADGDVLDNDGNPKMLWTWDNDSFNVVDWLTELFEKYNLSLYWDIDFDIAQNDLDARAPKYIVTVSAVTRGGGIIKDNVAMQTIAYKSNELPDATVCNVIDSESKSLLGTYYLYEKDGEYSVSEENDAELSDGRQRILPVKTAIVTFNQNSSGTGEITPEDAATDKLIPSQFSQAIEIKINSDSKMFDFVNAKFGDQYRIINEYGTINSIFTGKKFSNESKWVTLLFGLSRLNYTDIIQLKFRKSRKKEKYGT